MEGQHRERRRGEKGGKEVKGDKKGRDEKEVRDDKIRQEGEPKTRERLIGAGEVMCRTLWPFSSVPGAEFKAALCVLY